MSNRKSQGRLPLGFSMPFLCKVAYAFRLCCLFVPVQPFADIVADYTCCDRDKKCDYVYHKQSPPFCWRFGSTFIITYNSHFFFHFLIHFVCNYFKNIFFIHLISIASPKLKNLYRSLTASAYAFSMFSFPASADTSISRVDSGRWKFVISASRILKR